MLLRKVIATYWHHNPPQILELDSAHPYLQAGGMVFQGSYRDSIGTHLLLKKGEEEEEYTVQMTTEKELNCQKIVLLPRKEGEKD